MLRKVIRVIFFTAVVVHAQTPATREAAYRANNRGVALLEQYKYKEGAEEFRRALATAPDMFLPRVNLAIALYNVPDLEAAQREAEAAFKLKPDSPQAHYILGLIAKSQTRTEDALKEFQQVLTLDPTDTGANINAGQLYAQARQYDKATANFRLAVAAEPYNTSALYGLGQALLRNNAREEGQAVMQQFQKFRQNGAGTTLSNNYLEQGRYAEALASTGAEPDLVSSSVPAVKFVDATKEMLPQNNDQSRSKRISRVSSNAEAKQAWVNTAEMAYPRAGMALFDFDLDGDLDLVKFWQESTFLYRNDNGRLTDVTKNSGDLAKVYKPGRSVVAGDYDNDGKTDLLVLRYGDVTLFHNEGGGIFTDATKAANVSLPVGDGGVSAAFADADHDGDLDIFIAGLEKIVPDTKAWPVRPGRKTYTPMDLPPGSNFLLRNNGDGKFTDISAEAKLTESKGHAVAVVPTDYDNGRDVDFLVLNYKEPPTLYRNLRDSTFANVAKSVGLPDGDGFTCAAAGDFNKDGFTDFYFGSVSKAGVFAVSDGNKKFISQDGPKGFASSIAAQFLDFDNDGLLDLVALTPNGLGIARNVGNGWRDVSAQVNGPTQKRDTPLHRFTAFMSGDIDNDGDVDLILSSSWGDLKILRNEGGNRNKSVRVNLKGFVGNRSGIGAKVDIRAGSLGQKLEYYSASPAPAPADLVFGLGPRKTADAVRILWPSGIVQAEVAGLDTLARKPLSVTELDLKPSSCPFLYTWNGEKFEFITDFMGGGEMGYWEAPGLYNHPDPDEYVRLTDKQLQPKDGRYEVRVTNELEEVLFVDHLKLIAIAHPSDTEVYPDEGMGHAPYPAPLKIYKARPQSVVAWDDKGRDMTARLAKLDNKYADGFALHQIRGYAEQHSLTLFPGGAGVSPANALPGASGITTGSSSNESELQRKQAGGDACAPRCVLFLTGWTDYAFSSDNVAARQAGRVMQPPALQVKDKAGNWQTVIEDIGIPIGRPQTVTVDLTGKFLSDSREIRIVTNMRVYYDQILVGTGAGDFPVQVNELAPVVADLRWRGYSAEVRGAGVEQPINYDYAKVSPYGPWKTAPGRYTREGDARELLEKSDDNFVISRVGDELRLSFDAKQLPPPPAGWKRTFLLYGDGFSKELDINSATPHGTGPLPFHGMTKYPYDWPETYPLTPEREALQERYNTRVVNAELSNLFGF